MHGGISQNCHSWESFHALKKPHTPKTCDEGLQVDLMWADPTQDKCSTFAVNTVRDTLLIKQTSWSFSKEPFQSSSESRDWTLSWRNSVSRWLSEPTKSRRKASISCSTAALSLYSRLRSTVEMRLIVELWEAESEVRSSTGVADNARDCSIRDLVHCAPPENVAECGERGDCENDGEQLQVNDGCEPWSK